MHDFSFGSNATLVELSESHPHYIDIARRFIRGWEHPTKELPHLYSIYKINPPNANLQPYLEYRATVLGGNEDLLFHGTSRSCLLAESPRHIFLCGSSDCCLCSIVRDSFDVKQCGSKNKFRRFGTGIYTSACSSKADDYVHNVSPLASFRVLLVNRVVVGRAKSLTRNAPTLTRPPPGYDSVFGEPGDDSVLNYEETVVYSNDAIRPSHLIVYGEDPLTEVLGDTLKLLELLLSNL